MLEKLRNTAKIIGSFAVVFVLTSGPHIVWADSGGGYLRYQEPQAAGAGSWLSAFAYILSLFVTFTVVIGLAYFTTRIFGRKVGNLSMLGDNRVVMTLPLGQNRAIYIVEIAGKYLVVGVTDHNINLLQEITDNSQIEKLKQLAVEPSTSQFDKIFEQKVSALQDMAARFPNVFSKYGNSVSYPKSKDDVEKR